MCAPPPCRRQESTGGRRGAVLRRAASVILGGRDTGTGGGGTDGSQAKLREVNSKRRSGYEHSTFRSHVGCEKFETWTWAPWAGDANRGTSLTRKRPPPRTTIGP